MNRGLIEKTAREIWPAALLFSLGLMAVEVLLGYVLPVFQRDLGDSLLRLEFVRRLVEGLLGSRLGESLGPQLVTALPWVHPVVLAIVWAHELTIASRVPAGEIDRGTIDVLLGLPVSRWQLYLCESLVWALSGILLLLFALLGNILGSLASGEGSPSNLGGVLIVLVNALCLYAAVGGLSYLFSALSDRRGRALGAAVAIVLVSFLLNFLAQFWQPAQALSFLSLLDYYRPLLVLESGAWPLDDMLVLLAVAGVTWGTGAVVFVRRDISTV